MILSANPFFLCSCDHGRKKVHPVEWVGHSFDKRDAILTTFVIYLSATRTFKCARLSVIKRERTIRYLRAQTMCDEKKRQSFNASSASQIRVGTVLDVGADVVTATVAVSFFNSALQLISVFRSEKPLGDLKFNNSSARVLTTRSAKESVRATTAALATASTAS
ncbi:unnamed protein product [Ceratitis capitata]|uniref:(Mediterranean fruit fly) hypothetical protein n=1 Tax=Ceratitis capitata TaxID=7213 RepID=A0A811V358_CERCA|nr:unnamed protein product [Ceratitis capitata]